MKVKDLIKELEKYNPNGEIVLKCYIDTETIYNKGDNYVDTNYTSNYDLNVDNYEYENEDWSITKSDDVVLSFDIC